MLHRFLNGLHVFKYKDVLVLWYFLTFYWRRRNVGALFIGVFEGKISWSFVLDTVSVRMHTRSIGDCSLYSYSESLFKVHSLGQMSSFCQCNLHGHWHLQQRLYFAYDIRQFFNQNSIFLTSPLRFKFVLFYFIFIFVVACKLAFHLLSSTLVNELDWIISLYYPLFRGILLPFPFFRNLNFCP
jgi:hypothetical protein